MTEAIETSETIPAPNPAAKPKKKRASAATAVRKPKRKAAASKRKTKTTRAGERGKMAKAGDYAWAKKQDDSLSGLVRKAIEKLVR